MKAFKDISAQVSKRYPTLLGNDRARMIYALHHDGPSLKYGGATLADKGVLPFLQKYTAIVEQYQSSFEQ